MKYQVYSIKDTVTEQFAPPFLGENDNAAIRSFMLNKDKQPFPDDFALYLIGQYDSETGVVNGQERGPTLICDGEIIESARKNGQIK